MSWPTEIPGLVSFWDFQEPTGQPRKARGSFPAALCEAAGPIERVEGGVFGPYCAELPHGKYFNIPHAECGELKLKSQLTIVAWIQRHRKPEIQCEAVAGMWNETNKQRQYCLFLDLRIHGGSDNVCAHVSSTGGPTPGHPWCMDAAIGARSIGYSEWNCVAISYDGIEARVYLDGRLDMRAGLNPFLYPGRLYRGCSDFTVGAVHRGGEMGNWFVGRIGGLAVYRRALSEDEILRLSTNGVGQASAQARNGQLDSIEPNREAIE